MKIFSRMCSEVVLNAEIIPGQFLIFPVTVKIISGKEKIISGKI